MAAQVTVVEMERNRDIWVVDHIVWQFVRLRRAGEREVSGMIPRFLARATSPPPHLPNTLSPSLFLAHQRNRSAGNPEDGILQH